jgi:endonuclease YncB( thermonuclease family)
MSNEDILSQFNSLSPEGQRQVIDFIGSLQKRYACSQSIEGPESLELAQEGFIGMWQDREDMQDSSEWVRSNREHEWIKQGG